MKYGLETCAVGLEVMHVYQHFASSISHRSMLRMVHGYRAVSLSSET